MDPSHPVEAKQFRIERSRFEQTILLLQGGGALGSYQAGVYQALAEANLDPDWVAGVGRRQAYRIHRVGPGRFEVRLAAAPRVNR